MFDPRLVLSLRTSTKIDVLSHWKVFTEGTNKPKSMVSTLISGMFLESESSRKLTDLVELTNSVSTRPHTDKAVLIVGQPHCRRFC